MRAERGVVITGWGIVSALGDTPLALHAALCRGRTAVKDVSLFDVTDLRVRRAGAISDFDPTATLKPGNLRLLDRPAQLTAVAAHRALGDAGVDEARLGETDVGLVLGTLFGSLHTISAFDRRALEAGPQYAKPLDFANSVINAPAGQVAIWHNLRGINSTVCCGTASGIEAIAYAADQIAEGRADMILAGGADELCYESMLGFERLGRTAATVGADGDCPVPFDHRRCGSVLGEGAALVVLESEQGARRRGASPRGRILGSGQGFDPSLGHDDEAAVAALVEAGRNGLEMSSRRVPELGAICAGADGSRRGDLQEGNALHRLLEGLTTPRTAINGALGQSLGASGAFQAALLWAALETGRLPGIPGFECTEPELPSAGLSAHPRALEGRLGLLTSMGGEGHASALVLER